MLPCDDSVMGCHPRSLIRSVTLSRVPGLDLLILLQFHDKAVKDLFYRHGRYTYICNSGSTEVQTLQLRKCGWHARSVMRIFARLLPVVPLHIGLNLAIFWDYHQVPARHFDRKRNLRAAPIRMNRSKMCVEGHFGK